MLKSSRFQNLGKRILASVLLLFFAGCLSNPTNLSDELSIESEATLRFIKEQIVSTPIGTQFQIRNKISYPDTPLKREYKDLIIEGAHLLANSHYEIKNENIKIEFRHDHQERSSDVYVFKKGEYIISVHATLIPKAIGEEIPVIISLPALDILILQLGDAKAVCILFEKLLTVATSQGDDRVASLATLYLGILTDDSREAWKNIVNQWIWMKVISMRGNNWVCCRCSLVSLDKPNTPMRRFSQRRNQVPIACT